MRRVLLVFGVMAVAAACAPAALQSPAMITCPEMQTSPTIDGRVGATEWATAGAVGPFVLERGGMPSLVTQAWVGYDGTALYVAARMQDPFPRQMTCEAGERDADVFADDSLCIVLDPGDDGSGVIELAVNGAGIEYDAVDGDPQTPVAWRSAASIGESGWQVEAAYLFGTAGAPEEGARWGINLRRTVPRITETSSMTGERGAVGALRFGRPALRCEVPPLREPWYGENTTAVTLRNLSAAAMTVKLNVRVTGPTRRAHFFDVTKTTVGSGQSLRVPVSWQVQRGGACAVELSVQVVEGATATTVCRTVSMPFELPPLGAALDATLSRIADAYGAYVMLPEEARPFDGASRLDMLLARWRYLDSQQQQRAALTPEVVMALLARARALSDDAILLERELLRPPE